MKSTCVWVGAALLLANPLMAQQGKNPNDSIGTTVLNEVVVTANKLEQKQSQTGKVVSVITKEELERSAGRTLGQLLNEQAGITIPGALNTLGSPQTLSVRGASPGRTLVLIDGIPAYDPSLINCEFDLNLISINDLERVEIARGAQSTLYGSDAVGGVVNLITNKTGVQKPFNVKATTSYGSLNTFRGNLQVYGNTEKLSYSLRYTRLTTEGISAANDSTAKNNFDKDGYNGHNLGASLQYTITPKWLLRSFVQRNLYKADVDAGVFIDDRDFTIDNKNTMAGTGFRFNTAKLAITGNYQYSDISRLYVNDSGHVSGFAKYMTDDYFGRNQFLELYSNIKLGQYVTALVGTDYRYSSMNSAFLSLSSFGPYTSVFRDSSLFQLAGYGSLIFNRGPVNLEAGIRFNHHEQYGNNATYTFNPSVNISSHLRLFGSIASAFKAPSLFQLYSSFGNAALDPEKATTYEVGLQLSHASLTNRLVFFHRDISNAIDFDNLQFSYFNINKQVVSGLEWETNWKPLKSLTLTGNYTLLTAEERMQSRHTTKDTTYSYLLRRPKHNVNLTASYQLTEKLYTGVSGKYVSARYDVGGYQRPDVKMEGYFLLYAYAAYQAHKMVRIFADAQNLLNQTFFDIRGYNAIPRLVTLGVTVTL